MMMMAAMVMIRFVRIRDFNKLLQNLKKNILSIQALLKNSQKVTQSQTTVYHTLSLVC